MLKTIKHKCADHTVKVFGDLGACVTIPYKGFVISLAYDGSSTLIYETEDATEPVIRPRSVSNTICGTSGASIRKAMRIIDAITDEEEAS